MKSIILNTVVVIGGLAFGALLVSVAGCDDDPGLIDTDQGRLDTDNPLVDDNFEEADVDDQQPLEVDGIVPQRPLVVEDDDHGAETAADAFTESAARRDANDGLAVGYDRTNEVTIRGPVLGKEHVKLPDGHTGIVVELQPGGDFVDVLIGTTDFHVDHDINIGIADEIIVTGPIAELEGGGRLLLARELGWGDHAVELRDEDGEPNW